LTIELLPSDESSDSYIWCATETFVLPARDGTLRIIVTADEEVIKAAWQSTEFVELVICLSADKASGSDRPFNLQMSEGFGPAKRLLKNARVQELQRTAAQQFLESQGLDPAFSRKCKIFECRYVTSQKSITVDLETKLILALSEGFCYWAADALTYLSSLEISYRGIEREVRSVRLHQFLTTYGGISSHDEIGRKFKLEVNDWIFAGQGVLLTWQPKQDRDGTH
jgi:hypothetical protein